MMSMVIVILVVTMIMMMLVTMMMSVMMMVQGLLELFQLELTVVMCAVMGTAASNQLLPWSSR